MGKAKQYLDTWDGGFIRKDSKGRRTYVIRKMIAGRVYKVSTRAHAETQALVELRRFEADPTSYVPSSLEAQEAADNVLEPLLLAQVDDIDTAQGLGGEFLRWSRDVKKNTPKWVAEQRLYLNWWSERLDGLDLRTADLAKDIDPHIPEGTPARAPKIAVLKAFYSWLVKGKRSLRPEEDPTYRVLTVPQAKPAQWDRSRLIARDDFDAVRAHLPERYRDGLEVLAGTGWHVTELVRFARGGEVLEPAKAGKGQKADKSVAGVLVCPLTKGKETLRVAVGAEVRAAGERIRALGAFSQKNFRTALAEASTAAGLKKTLLPGNFRHSVASLAIESGASPAAVAAFLGHRDPRTTKKYYATHATPAKVPTLL